MRQLQLVHLQTNAVLDLPQKFYSLQIGSTRPKNYLENDIDIFVDVSQYSGASIVSGLHFEIQRVRDKYFVKDLESANGTYLNGSRLEPFKPFALKPGYRIDLGKGEKFSFVFTEVGMEIKLRGNYGTEEKKKSEPKIKKPFFDISGLINSLITRIKKLIQKIVRLILISIATVILIVIFFKVVPLIPSIISSAPTPSIPSIPSIPDVQNEPLSSDSGEKQPQSKPIPDTKGTKEPQNREQTNLAWFMKKIRLKPDNESLIIAQQQKATLVKYSIYRKHELYTWVIKPNGDGWEVKATLTKNNRKLDFQSFFKDYLSIHQNLGVDKSGFISIDSLKYNSPEHADYLKQIRQSLYTMLIYPIENSPQFSLSESLIFVPDTNLNLAPFAVLVDENERELQQKYTILNKPQN
jgi:pSer/pThr/pTyr-binding forkhead associated (FHA) protein